MLGLLIKEARKLKQQTELQGYEGYQASLEAIVNGTLGPEEILIIQNQYKVTLEQLEKDVELWMKRHEKAGHMTAWKESQPVIAEIDKRYAKEVADFEAVTKRHEEKLQSLRGEAAPHHAKKDAADSARTFLIDTVGERHKEVLAQISAEQRELGKEHKAITDRIDRLKSVRIGRDSDIQNNIRRIDETSIDPNLESAEQTRKRIWDEQAAVIEDLQRKAADLNREMENCNTRYTQAQNGLCDPRKI